MGWLGRESEVRKQVPRGKKTWGFGLGFGFRAFGLRVELRVSGLECRASGLDTKITTDFGICLIVVVCLGFEVCTRDYETWGLGFRL